MNKARLAIGIVVGLVVLVVGGTWVYINLIKEDAPDKLTLDTPSTTTTAGSDAGSGDTTTTAAGATSSAGIDGTWKTTDGSEVGYRVVEVLFGQDTEGVGRTSDVDGSMTISGTEITDATFTVDMTSMKSDSGQRDNQFNNRIMETGQFPTSTFELTEPIQLNQVPDDGQEITVEATGDLTLKDTTKSIKLEITAKRTGDTISTLSTYKVVFADWGIDNPSAGPAQTEDNGLLEIKLVFAKG